MMPVFTYHEVKDCAPGREPEFYTVAPAELANHLETMAHLGVQSLKMDELKNSAPENKFILTFDDGTVDHHETVLPILEKHRCRGCFFIPTAKLNKPGYLTSAQVREIAAMGHEVGSHSHEHQRMDILSEEEVRRQIALSQEILAEIIGIKPVTFVPPGGFTNARIRQVAGELGIRAMRTMRWGQNHKFDPMGLETIPLNRYTGRKKFLQLLKPRGTPMLYTMKESLKCLIPMRQYERLRRLAFKFRKLN